MARTEGPKPGEMILGKHGQWLGNFAQEHVVPADSTRFSLRYPVGWTNATWYELAGCNLHWAGCSCTDCRGTHVGYLIDQRHPGDTIDPCWTGLSLDDWAVSITPKICQEGCSNCLVQSPCISLSGSDSVVCGGRCGGASNYAGWPLVHFGHANPSADIRVVTDTSGPSGLEDMKAMRIDFSGSGAEGASFVGEDGGHDANRPPYENSSVPPPDDTSLAHYYRYSTGVTIRPHKCYRFTCWVKAVPDRYGYTCTGYNFQAMTKYFTVIRSIATVTLNGSWQYLAGEWTEEFLDDPMYNAPILLQTTHRNSIDPDEVCDGVVSPPFEPSMFTVTKPRGRVHVKAVHLYKCKQEDQMPLHVWRWH